MRYKFRAYEKSTGKMYNCFGFNRLENEIYISSIAIDDFVEGVLETVHSVTEKLNEYVVVQTTGLTDKNGVEIYEGDILRLLNSEVLCEVVYEAPSFCRRWINPKVSSLRGVEMEPMAHNTYITYEVIGNIYQNKELLKEIEYARD